MSARTDLVRVTTDLGATLLEVVLGQPSTVELGGVAFYDPFDAAYLPSAALVLAVGINSSDDVCSLLTSLRGTGAVGLVVRSPVRVTDQLRQMVQQTGITLIGLVPGASWTQLAAMVRSLMSEEIVGDDRQETLGGIPTGDLFALANAITALIDVPVTIEDRSSRVLAFSSRQHEADSSRVETILGRQVPERFTRDLVDKGILNELYASPGPVWIDPEPAADDQLPRVAIAVRAGNEVLGSIWAAVKEPLNDDRLTALTDAAKLVALHMMRHRADFDNALRLRADLLTSALRGGPGSRGALARLVGHGEMSAFLAVGLARSGPESVDHHVSRTGELERLASAFAMHLSVVHPRCAVAQLGETCYGMIPITDGTRGLDSVVRIAHEFLGRVTNGDKTAIGVGSIARSSSQLSTAQASADRALRVLLDSFGKFDRNVATFDEVHSEALMLELCDQVKESGDRPTGPVARLLEHDHNRDTRLLETLEAWLNSFGDIPTAAASLIVHANTFRYRLKRAAEVGGIDLGDPDQRFSAMLQLRIVRGTEPDGGR
ncbi:PucR family transcriptional regulator [Rhodococcus sp. EPR-157]|uniref:PucR family transcriptional regulator n=1 Tax=Rhodococcus sp. EPR-157 TaxID=1813677 RepID=UPI0007BBF19B|nr:helix-turn-helix domain-containing protein [Rhodococcus sp. EPR-157]KZF06564.1 PucR family transcriptional regulator [Rhodococcus sp. EPR-157]